MKNIPDILKNRIKTIIFKVKELEKTIFDNLFKTKSEFNNKTYFNQKILNINDFCFDDYNFKNNNYQKNMFLKGRFNYLGSGWVYCGYNSDVLGFDNVKYDSNILLKKIDNNGFWLESLINRSNLKSSKKIWKKIRNPRYIPLDWQKDYKSGYRWNLKNTSSGINKNIGKKYGVDIKTPWELSRMHHLLLMAILSVYNSKDAYSTINYFHDNILDFISLNPPRYGVNWVCTMEVSIRVINMLLAFDIFKQLDKLNILDDTFTEIFLTSVYEHGLHIFENLEFNSKFTTNHYLSNIAGLIFISRYLKPDKTTINWLHFSINELVKETEKQFYDDGGNYESSSCYHKLSSEILVYSFSVLLGMEQNILKHLKKNYQKMKISPNKCMYSIIKKEEDYKICFSDRLIKKFFKIGVFLKDIMKNNNNIPQIGDNDSGHFIKLSSYGEFMSNSEAQEKYLNLKGYINYLEKNEYKESYYFDENNLNVESLIGCFKGIFLTDKEFNNGSKLEESFIKNLSGNNKLKIAVEENKENNIQRGEKYFLLKNSLKYLKKQTFIGKNLKYKLKNYFYPESGIILFKSDELYLCFYSTPVGQNGNGGHSHNDKGSVELVINNCEILKDPGSYIYTADPKRRNLYRSTPSHNCISVDNIEQNNLENSVEKIFKLKETYKSEILEFNDTTATMLITYKNIKNLRTVKIYNNKIHIIDRCNKRFEINKSTVSYSNGYGKLYK
ncbi:MAG: hypothetical protein C0601_10960 [Candidatus Muiribacterium halophilum]|uniref:Uncharacterized protein n=1 Tax=Muiribacterium halophilum TaxID=2053465 RepID=A0A2N5ZBV4_MUIH1|nr:MAG: hypothetical protein C0601_10960 [Candidatus Muirbacterium halophilum]